MVTGSRTHAGRRAVTPHPQAGGRWAGGPVDWWRSRYGRRVLHLPLWLAIVVDVAAWAVIGVSVGYALHRTPRRRLDHDTWLTRPRRWERGGRAYERLGIRRWKDAVPELGALFAGGVSKRSTGGLAGLPQFAAETRRAEYTHWLVMAAGPLFVLWNPWYLAVVMVVYAVVANLPCLVIQRYNRARITRIANRARAPRPPDLRGGASPDGAPRPDAGGAPTGT
jgi:glycosyl-4,4'-diaponeurosporenoate acyltransferase